MIQDQIFLVSSFCSCLHQLSYIFHNDTNTKHDDEIDLIELFVTLWSGKWLISGCAIVTIAIASLYLIIAEPQYESSIEIKSILAPPFSTSPINDFIEKFYAIETFDKWQNTIGQQDIKFSDLQENEELDGFLVKKPENELLAQFTAKSDTLMNLIVKTNDPQTINSIISYLKSTEQDLIEDYDKLVNRELLIINKQDLTAYDLTGASRDLLLDVARYLENIANGNRLMKIGRPTFPVKTSPKTYLILALSIILGGLVGCAAVLLKNAIRNRELLNKK